jgi:antitoxin (DNA-binding transcriptional repressor) of toxin-antitoxin stability system
MLNKKTTVHQTKTHLSQLLNFVVAGNEVTIYKGKAKTPLAKLVPVNSTQKKRVAGTLKRKIKIAKDFDELPEFFMEHFKPPAK